MKILSILFVGWSGCRLGKADLRVEPVLISITVVCAAVLHALVRLALPHASIEWIADSAARSWWFPALAPVALLETSGIWLPVLIIRWAEDRTRIAASAYIIGAATQGALVCYYPFDVVIFNGEVLGPTHPDYEVALVFGLVFAAIPFIVGLIAKRRQQTIVLPKTLRPTGDAQ